MTSVPFERVKPPDTAYDYVCCHLNDISKSVRGAGMAFQFVSEEVELVRLY